MLSTDGDDAGEDLYADLTPDADENSGAEEGKVIWTLA